MGFCYGIDAEMVSKNKKWIFGLGYSYNQNKKKYTDSKGEQFQNSYYVNIVLRNIERTFAIFVDRKINNNKKDELYAGLGHVFSHPEDQLIDAYYIPGNRLSIGVSGAPLGSNNIEGGLVSRFKWQHNWKSDVKFGAEFKVHFLYSIGSFTNICLQPYLKVNF